MKNLAKTTRYLKVQFLWESGTRNASQISAKAKIPLHSCERYVSILNSGGSLGRKPGSVGHNKITPQTRRKIISKTRNRRKSIETKTIAQGSHCSQQTVRKVLKGNGFRFRKLTRRRLTKTVKEKRVLFCQEMLARAQDLEDMMFVDETSVWLNKSQPNYGWEPMDIEEEGPYFRSSNLHGPKVHVWGGISLRGTTRLEIFEENMNGELYRDILQKHYKDMKKLYPEGFIFHQDNDRKHLSKVAMRFIKKNFKETLKVPPYSPDLNFIEMIWAWLKAKVAKDACKTIQLKKSIRAHWRQIYLDFLQPYIDGLRKRWQWVLENKGLDYIKD